MIPPTLVVLCELDPRESLRRCVGQSRFLGEAGLALAERGVRLLCAEPGAGSGVRPVRGGWREEPLEGVIAVYDRHRRDASAAMEDWGRRGIPVANPPRFRELCDDKLAFAAWARRVDLPVARTVDAGDPAWRRWDDPYVKPRRGWGGEGVRRLAGRPPAPGEIVQQAVDPAIPGESIRLLLQRDVGRGWIPAGALVRRDATGHGVASLRRGAAAIPLGRDREAELAPLVGRLIDSIPGAPGGEGAIEVGVDLVIGGEGPRILEWNSRPGRSFERIGRGDLRRQAQLRPFLMLLSS